MKLGMSGLRSNSHGLILWESDATGLRTIRKKFGVPRPETYKNVLMFSDMY